MLRDPDDTLRGRVQPRQGPMLPSKAAAWASQAARTALWTEQPPNDPVVSSANESSGPALPPSATGVPCVSDTQMDRDIEDMLAIGQAEAEANHLQRLLQAEAEEAKRALEALLLNAESFPRSKGGLLQQWLEVGGGRLPCSPPPEQPVGCDT